MLIIYMRYSEKYMKNNEMGNTWHAKKSEKHIIPFNLLKEIMQYQICKGNQKTKYYN